MERPRRSKDNSPSKHETREARYMRLRADVQQWIEREQEKKHGTKGTIRIQTASTPYI
jgi:hypothetical protein